MHARGTTPPLRLQRYANSLLCSRIFSASVITTCGSSLAWSLSTKIGLWVPLGDIVATGQAWPGPTRQQCGHADIRSARGPAAGRAVRHEFEVNVFSRH